MTRVLQLIWRYFWLTVAVVLITAAVLLTLARLALPFAGGYQRTIEAAMSDYLGAEVSASALDLEWHRLGPRLRMDGVSVDHPDGDVIRFDQAFIEFGIALPFDELRIRDVILSGLDLEVRLDADDHVHFWGLDIDAADLFDGSGADEPDTGALPAGPGGDLIAGLLAVDRLQLVDSGVRITDAAGGTHRIDDLNIRLLNDRGRHRVAVSGRPPATWGDALRLVVDARDLPDDDGGLRGELYLAGEGIELGRWQGLLPDAAAALPVRAGRADAGVWADWEGGRVQGITARLDASGLAIGPDDGEATRVESVAGTFDWRRRDDGWLLRGTGLELVRDGDTWTSESFALERTGTRWRGRGDALHLADIAAIARVLPAAGQVELPAGLAPRGELRDYAFAVTGEGGFRVSADVTDLGWSPAGDWPGVSGVDGRLRLTPRGGDIDIDARDVVYVHPGMFRDPLRVERIEGSVSIERTADTVVIDTPRLAAANADISAEARMRMTLQEDRSPLLDMEVDFRDGDGSTTSRYLPVGIMPSAVVDWLDEAIVDGHVPAGRARFHGRTADFPFDDGSGVFDVEFDVVDTTLAYAPEWPRVEALDARVRFHGTALGIEGRRARILDSPVTAVTARFDDLATGELAIEASATPQLSDLVRLASEGPLAGRLGAFFGGATTDDGSVALELGLEIPVEHADDTRVDGRIELAGNRLAQPRFGVDLADIDGSVAFTGDSVTIDGARADLHGQRVTLNADTRDDGIHLHAHGDLDPGAMLPPGGERLAAFLEGAAPWDIRVRIAGQTDSGLPEETWIEAESPLTGTRVALPAPLAKAADETRRLHLVLPIEPERDRQRFFVHYGDDLRLAAEFATDDGIVLHRGTLGIGAGQPELRPVPGLYIEGALDTIDLHAWAGVLGGGEAGAPLVDPPAGAGDGLMAGTDVRIGRAHWRGHAMTGIELHASRRDGDWRIDLTSDQVAGEIDWPAGRSDGSPLSARLERLDLGRLLAVDGDGEAGGDDANAAARAVGGVHPADLPAMDLRVGRLLLGDYTIRDVALITAPGGDGLTAHRLEAGSDTLRVEGQGSWQRRGEREQTSLRLTLRTTDFGAGLAELGLDDSGFVEGDGRVVTELEWGGVPWSPDLETLAGQMRIRLDDGRITTVDPGAARLISLFSLQTLPRRLALDFSSLFQRGFEYDRIRGRLNFDDGNAWVTRLEMEGPPGRARVSGRIGYVAEDFDQEIVFRPALTYSLPVLGAIAGGPIGGLTVAVIQQVMRGLGSDIESVAEVHYSLTGTWAEPNLEQMRIEAPEALRDQSATGTGTGPGRR